MDVIEENIFLSLGTLHAHVDTDCPAGTFVAGCSEKKAFIINIFNHDLRAGFLKI
jgi:hypothetical protein